MHSVLAICLFLMMNTICAVVPLECPTECPLLPYSLCCSEYTGTDAAPAACGKCQGSSCNANLLPACMSDTVNSVACDTTDCVISRANPYCVSNCWGYLTGDNCQASGKIAICALGSDCDDIGDILSSEGICYVSAVTAAKWSKSRRDIL